jgi:hypothetical protein
MRRCAILPGDFGAAAAMAPLQRMPSAFLTLLTSDRTTAGAATYAAPAGAGGRKPRGSAPVHLAAERCGPSTSVAGRRDCQEEAPRAALGPRLAATYAAVVVEPVITGDPVRARRRGAARRRLPRGPGGERLARSGRRCLPAAWPRRRCWRSWRCPCTVLSRMVGLVDRQLGIDAIGGAWRGARRWSRSLIASWQPTRVSSFCSSRTRAAYGSRPAEWFLSDGCLCGLAEREDDHDGAFILRGKTRTACSGPARRCRPIPQAHDDEGAKRRGPPSDRYARRTPPAQRRLLAAVFVERGRCWDPGHAGLRLNGAFSGPAVETCWRGPGSLALRVYDHQPELQNPARWCHQPQVVLQGSSGEQTVDCGNRAT